MNTIESNQKWIFIVVFSIVALLINSTQGFGNTRRTMSPSPITYQPSPPSAQANLAAQNAAQAAQQAEQKAAKAAKAATEEHAKFLARYLNGSFTRQAGSQNVAIAVANESGRPSSAITTALTRHFHGSSVHIFTSFFTPEFISDGLFNDALTGSRDLFRKLDLAGTVDTLVLAKEDVQYAQNPALENVITATIQLEVTVVADNPNAIRRCA